MAPQACVPAGGQEGAPQEDDDDGRAPGDVQDEEQAQPQLGGVPLQAPGLLDRGGDDGLAVRPDAQGVDGLGVLHGLGHRAVEAGEGRRAGPVGGHRDRQVPAHHSPHGRHDDEQAGGQQRVAGGGRDNGEHDRHRAHHDLGDAHAHEELDARDVVGGAAHEVAGAGGLDGAQRQVDDAVHHALAQVGEDRLAERAGVHLGEAVDDRARDGDDRNDQDNPVDVAGGAGARGHARDQAAQQLRGHQRRQDRDHLEGQHAREAPPVRGHDPEGLAQGDLAGGDGERHQLLAAPAAVAASGTAGSLGTAGSPSPSGPQPAPPSSGCSP